MYCLSIIASSSFSASLSFCGREGTVEEEDEVVLFMAKLLRTATVISWVPRERHARTSTSIAEAATRVMNNKPDLFPVLVIERSHRTLEWCQLFNKWCSNQADTRCGVVQLSLCWGYAIKLYETLSPFLFHKRITIVSWFIRYGLTSVRSEDAPENGKMQTRHGWTRCVSRFLCLRLFTYWFVYIQRSYGLKDWER